MNRIDKHIVLDLLSREGIKVQEDPDGDLVLIQGADDDFPYNVVVYIIVNNNRLCFVAAAPQFKPQGNLLELVNRFNCDYSTVTAYVREGAIRVSTQFIIDEEVSERYIVRDCLFYPLSAIWHAFTALQAHSQSEI